MITKCHFCMERDPVVRIPGPLTSRGPVVFELCQECADAKEKADANRERAITEMDNNDVSQLCVGCGICCFVLQAKVTHEEAEIICKDNGIEKDDFVEKTEVGSFLYPNDLTIKLPCHFLLGKPLGKWTACKIHDKIRPAVCGSYLCKMAIRYQLGTISLNEARYWLRTSIISKDLSIFNWVRDNDQEMGILLSSAIAGKVSKMRADGLDEDEIRTMVASLVTPHYSPRSELDQLAVDMHFATHDRGDDDPKVFFSEKELEDSRLAAMSPIEVLQMTITRVVSTFRQYFDRSRRSGLENVIGISEANFDKLVENIPDHFGTLGRGEPIVQPDCTVAEIEAEPNPYETLFVDVPRDPNPTEWNRSGELRPVTQENKPLLQAVEAIEEAAELVDAADPQAREAILDFAQRLRGEADKTEDQ